MQNLKILSKPKIVDSGLNLWRVLHANDVITGTNVDVMETPFTFPLPLSRDAIGNEQHIVKLKSTSGDRFGLISGIAFDNGKCPKEIALGHYDPVFARITTPLGPIRTNQVVDPGKLPLDKIPGGLGPVENHVGVTGLNKDNPGKMGDSYGGTSSSGFPDARNGALKQTIHEWCRLVNLVNGKDGVAGLKLLFDSWALGAGNAVKPCLAEIPSLKDIVASPPFVISPLLTGKSAEPPSLTPPPTGELPGLICGDGSVPTLTGCADGSLPTLGKSGETPPVETPPVETPPVETPPVETPPVETPPVETPPVGFTRTNLW